MWHLRCCDYCLQTSNSSIAQAVRAARAVTAPITVQELAAVVNPSPNRIRAHNTAQVITTTTLTPAQFIAAQKGGTVTVGMYVSDIYYFLTVIMIRQCPVP